MKDKILTKIIRVIQRPQTDLYMLECFCEKHFSLTSGVIATKMKRNQYRYFCSPKCASAFRSSKKKVPEKKVIEEKVPYTSNAQEYLDSMELVDYPQLKKRIVLPVQPLENDSKYYYKQI